MHLVKLLLATVAISFSILSPITIAPATAAPSLVTCIKFQSGAERISKTGTCRIGQEAQANWKATSSDLALSSEPTIKTLTVCSNKPRSTVKYQIIRAKCAPHQVSTLYSRSAVLASAPIIATAISRGYNSAALILTKDLGVNPDAPIAFFTITSSKGDTQNIYYWRELDPVINKLAPLTTYTFTITATTADGTSSSSYASKPVTTPDHVLPSPRTTESAVIYTVGQTGPGGGIIFYVSVDGFNCGTGFTNTGSPTAGLCHYLEAAPADWSSPGVATEDANFLWAVSANDSLDVDGVTGGGGGIAIINENPSSNPNNSNTGIGLGYRNTIAIVDQGNDSTTAAGAARAYAGGSKNDWYLPTTAELNQLCKWQGGLVWNSDATICTGGTRNSGSGASGFKASIYWSSSEYNGIYAWTQSFTSLYQDGDRKFVSYPIRPIRAF